MLCGSHRRGSQKTYRWMLPDYSWSIDTKRENRLGGRKGGQAVKRLTINQIEKFIQTLESTERIDGDTENQKQGAISYLTNYRVRLEERGKKSVKLEEDKL